MEQTNLISKDISAESWREYDFSGRIYLIKSPKTLYMRIGGTTHRVVDKEGVVHCLPAPGEKGCVLRWFNTDQSKPVTF